MLLVQLASMNVFILCNDRKALLKFFVNIVFQLLCCFLWKKCFERGLYFTLSPQQYYYYQKQSSRGVLNVLLEISENSQENTCARV